MKELICPNCGCVESYADNIISAKCKTCGILMNEFFDVNQNEIKKRLQYDNDAFTYNSKRALKIKEAAINMVNKIKFLDKNKKFNYSLSKMTLMIGSNLINIFKEIDETNFGPANVDEYGNTFLDFLESDNNFAFNEIDDLIKDIKRDKKTYKENKQYIDMYEYVLYLRSELLDIYGELIDLIDNSFDRNGEILDTINKCKSIISNSAIKLKELKYISNVDEYINGQFDIIEAMAIDTLEYYDYTDDRKKWKKYLN